MALNYCLSSLCPFRQLPVTEVSLFFCLEYSRRILHAWHDPLLFSGLCPSITSERPSLISFSIIVLSSFAHHHSFLFLTLLYFYHCLPLNNFAFLSPSRIWSTWSKTFFPHLSSLRVHNKHILGFSVWISFSIPLTRLVCISLRMWIGR